MTRESKGGDKPIGLKRRRAIEPGDYADIAATIVRRQTLLDVYRICREILARVMPADNCFVALEEGPDGLTFPYYVDEVDSENSLEVYPREGLAARVIAEGKTLLASAEKDFFAKADFIGQPAEDWLGVPLVDRTGRPFGAFVTQTYEPGERYSEEQVALAEFAAGQISLAVQFRAVDREMAVRGIAALVDETADLDILYPGIHGLIAELIPAAAHSFIIARIDRERGLFVPVYWRDSHEDFDALRWGLSEGLSGYVCSGEGRSFVYQSGATEPPAGYGLLGVQSAYWLGAPIKAGSEIIGIMMIQSYDDESPLTKEDERLMAAIAPSIGLAIARTEMLRRVRAGRPEA